MRMKTKAQILAAFIWSPMHAYLFYCWSVNPTEHYILTYIILFIVCTFNIVGFLDVFSTIYDLIADEIRWRKFIKDSKK